jgi:hypothetical protein
MHANTCRTSYNDDGKGMDQPLNDTNVALGRHIISFALSKAAATAAAADLLQVRTKSTMSMLLPLQLNLKRGVEGNLHVYMGTCATWTMTQAHTPSCCCCGVLMLQLHARHHQQYLNDPLQLAFSPLLPPGTFIRETSTFLQPPLQSQATATTETPAAAAGAAGAASTVASHLHHRSSSSSSSGNGSSGSGWPSLPPNVHVLSLQWRSCSTLLVRLVNIFQAGEERPQGSLSPAAAAAAAGGASNAAAAATSSREPLAQTTQARDHPRDHFSDTATVQSLWKLFKWGGSQESEAAVGAWHPGLSVVDIKEVTLFGGQRQLTESDLQPALKGWPLGDSITQWEPTLWPPAGSDTSSSTTTTTSPVEIETPRAPGRAAAEAEAGRYSFLSNRVVGPMDAAEPITLAPMQVRLTVPVPCACSSMRPSQA